MRQRKLKIPEINSYMKVSDFLRDFYELNKAAHGFFSFRYWAKRCRLSASYLNDVVAGRKKLSLAQALKLIEFLELKGIRAERFILLALFGDSSLNSPTVQQFLAASNSNREIQTMTRAERGLFTSVLMFEVIEYLLWRRGTWDIADFLRYTTIRGEIGQEALDSVIRSLQEKKFIRREAGTGRFVVSKDELYQDYSNRADGNIIPLELGFLENYRNFLGHRTGRWTFFSGMVQIAEDRLSDLADRMAALRNHLYELDREARSEGESSGRKIGVHQFSLNHFPIFGEGPKPS